MPGFLADYPPWFAIAAGTVAAVLLIWLFMKVVKIVLWVLLVAVLAGGAALTVWALLR